MDACAANGGNEPNLTDAAVCMNVSLPLFIRSVMFLIKRADEYRRSKIFAGNGALRMQQRRSGL
jgi:hypothetical protein